MSSVSVRPSTTTTDVGYGEQEQDANSALLELDKGLRSSKVGEQCEAIVRFPRLFEKYPFPILINSAFLKLADVFRDGTNFLRLCVLKVTQQSSKHLDKILNVDEFVRRIFFVIHSNDPVARAITLRVLGSIAPIISERKNAHHSIHTGLDSHDRVELEAAIYSSSCFAAESRTFAAGICSKLADLIQGLATPADMKLKLIPIFRHMHQDRQSAALARQVCQEMLPSYPAKEFLTTTLHTLSQLAAASLIDIPDQVNLLLHYLKDPRQVVKTMCLKDLQILAVKAPHMWSAENLCELRAFCDDTESSLLITQALDVLCVLSRTPALLTGEKGKVVSEMCGSLCHHWDVSIVARAIQVQTKLACWNPAGEDNKNVETQTQLALSTEAVIVQCLAADVKGRKAAQVLKLALECVKSLSQACPAVVPGFVDTLTMTLTASQGESTLAICQCLASVAEYNPQLLSSHMDSLRQLYNTALGMDYERDSIEGRVLVGLAVLVLLGDKEKHGYSSVSTNVNELVSLHPWPAYRIARQAARLGCHRTAADIFAKLSTQIASEHFYYWLCALHQFCLAETCLTALPDDIPKLVPALSKGLEHYEKGIAQLKAASTPSHPLQFQCEFMRLRADMLHNCLMLLTCTASIRTCPPPAIAPAVAMTTGQELLRCGRLAIEMQNCYSQIQQLSEKYIQLHQASFDADPDTLNKIHMLQQQCLLLAHVVDSLILSNPAYRLQQQCLLLAHVVDSLILSNPAYSTNKQPAILESFSAAQGPGHNWARGLMERAVSDILGHLQKVLMETGGQPISHLHMDCLYRTCVTLLRLAFSSPRYFFQALQSTSIKLAMSPTARSSADPVLVATDTHLTSKIEGVIQHGQKPGLFRKVCKVKLSVSSVCTAAAKVPGKLPDVDQVNNKCTWLVEPHHDYFSQQILLSFPVPGYHTVTVDTSVIDEEGYCWKTGPKLTLSVKSHDERAQQREREKQQQQQQQQAAQAARTLTAK